MTIRIQSQRLRMRCPLVSGKSLLNPRWVGILLLIIVIIPTISVAATKRVGPFEQNSRPGGIALVALGESTAPEPAVKWDSKTIAVVADSEQWWAIVGIPLGTKAGSHSLQIRWPDGDSKDIKFTVNAHTYKEQRLIIKNKRKVNPAPLDMKRINKENRRIREVKAYRYKKLLTNDFTLPLKGVLTSPFGLRRFYNEQPRRPHGGIDIAANTGTPVYAPAKGLVVDTGDYFFNGNSVFLEHGLGLQSFYAHLSKIHVKPGDTVQAGDLLGEVGATGRVTGPHLHWSVGLNGTWIDPDLVMSGTIE